MFFEKSTLPATPREIAVLSSKELWDVIIAAKTQSVNESTQPDSCHSPGKLKVPGPSMLFDTKHTAPQKDTVWIVVEAGTAPRFQQKGKTLFINSMET